MQSAHSLALPLEVAAVLVLAACSSGDNEAAPTHTPNAACASPGATPAPTTPSPTPSPTPLSPFEDEPAVQALRAFYVAVARAVYLIGAAARGGDGAA